MPKATIAGGAGADGLLDGWGKKRTPELATLGLEVGTQE